MTCLSSPTRSGLATIPLPERGVTLLPPWPQAIVFADKRLENRGKGIATNIGTWRGLLAITQSKAWNESEADAAARSIRAVKLATLGDLTAVPWAGWAGKLVAVAELLDVLPPERCESDPWHAAGQYGLIFGTVWEVEPVPIIGGRGCWFAGQCPQCDSLQARDRFDGFCRRCGVRPGGLTEKRPWTRPELTIVRECVL